uniref:Uncharacterized protein n=1 Tax=Rhizophagus irregularis (strain DAOM 181602 / DAOM 197198 / MUCL 43194) TaxID=747089 RepID=U9UL18_RHIID
MVPLIKKDDLQMKELKFGKIYPSKMVKSLEFISNKSFALFTLRDDLQNERLKFIHR